MNLIYFFIVSSFLYSSDLYTKKQLRPCTCTSYELKDQIRNAEIISHAKVIKIDTIRISTSSWCKDEVMRKAAYERKESMVKVTFKNKACLKGVLKSDTFSVISLNYCEYSFSNNLEYIVVATHAEFCEFEMIKDSIKYNTISFFCTNDCSGNSIYYPGAKERYLENLK